MQSTAARTRTLSNAHPPKVGLPTPKWTTRKKDIATVKQAIQEINRINREMNEQKHMEIGQYLVNTFFDGDINNYGAPGTLNYAWEALKQRGDGLDFSVAKLCKILNAMKVDRELPAACRKALTYSHKAHLAVVKDPTVRNALAEKTVERKWSTRQLHEKIQQVLATAKGKTGQPTAKKRLAKLVKQIVGGRIDRMQAAKLLADPTTQAALADPQSVKYRQQLSHWLRKDRQAAEALWKQLDDLLKTKLRKAS